MTNRIWQALLAIVIGLFGFWGLWVFSAHFTRVVTPPVEPCQMRIVEDKTFATTDDCWVVLECKNGESFESLFRGDNTMECVEFLNNQK